MSKDGFASQLKEKLKEIVFMGFSLDIFTRLVSKKH